MKTVTNKSICAILTVLTLGGAVVLAAEPVKTATAPAAAPGFKLTTTTPGMSYADAFEMSMVADKAFEKGDYAKAYSHYAGALQVIEQIKVEWPTWHPDIVATRAKHCRFQLQKAAEHLKGDLPAPAVQPTPANPNAVKPKPALVAEVKPKPAATPTQPTDTRFTPKTVPITPVPAEKLVQTPAPEGFKMIPAAQDAVIVPRLDGLVIVKSFGEVEERGVSGVSGLLVRNIPLLEDPLFREVVRPYFGFPFKKSSFQLLSRDIVLYCRSKNHPVVQIILPEQEVKEGTVQIWFMEAKIGAVTVENDGKRWFSDNSIRKQVDVQVGQPLDSAKLVEDLDWLNRNPFRRVEAQLRPGTKAGEANIALQVEDRLPVRVFAGYETSGTDLTGQDRLLYGFNWGNAFWQGHELSYQNTVDTSFKKVGAHSGSYVAPLPWRHIAAVYATYVDTDVSVSTLDLKGSSLAASLRYTVPLQQLRTYRHEVTLGFDYKSTDNDMLFGGETVTATKVDVGQFQIGYSGTLPDRWGQTAFAVSFFVSPGGIVGNDTDEDYETLRPGAEASYYYLRVVAERVTRLPWDFSWVIRGTGQYALTRLLPSEELGLSVRAYDDYAESGDIGFFIANELRTPPISPLRRWFKVQDRLQFLAFVDYGLASRIDADKYFEDDSATLASVGAGLRYSITPYLYIAADYGFKIGDRTDEDDGSRGHISVTVGY